MARATAIVRPASAADHAAWRPSRHGYRTFHEVEQAAAETRTTWR